MKSIQLMMLATVVTATFTSVALNQNNAYATKSDKVTICHATNSQTNPYVQITVNSSSITELNNPHGTNGHGDHDGLVWHQGIADHSWGDIIPAFESPAGHSYAGMNMTAEGKAILDNGCKVETSTPATPTMPKSDDHSKDCDKDKGNEQPGKGGGAPTTPTTPTTPTPSATSTQSSGSGTATQLPETGFNSLALLSTLGVGGGTYGFTFLIRKLLNK